MDANDLEPFYNLDNINGVALAGRDGQVEENQLYVSVELAAEICSTFASIFLGLESSGRKARSFLVRTDRHQFLGIPLKQQVLVMQFDPGTPIDAALKESASIIGAEMEEPPMAATAVQEPSPANASTTQPSAAFYLDPTSSGQVTGPISGGASPGNEFTPIWQEIHEDYVRAMGKVAPQNLARSLVKDAVRKVLDGRVFPESLAEIYAIGQTVVLSVPNKGRRRLVEKEIQIIAQRHNLSS